MDILYTLREAAKRVLADRPVLFAYLFGSQAQASADSYSDVDVAVLVEDSVPPSRYLDLSLGLARDLEEAARLGPLDVVAVLNEAPLPLAGRVVREGKILYSRDESRRARYESRIFREFTDFDLRARRLDEELIRAHAEGRR